MTYRKDFSVRFPPLKRGGNLTLGLTHLTPNLTVANLLTDLTLPYANLTKAPYAKPYAIPNTSPTMFNLRGQTATTDTCGAGPARGRTVDNLLQNVYPGADFMQNGKSAEWNIPATDSLATGYVPEMLPAHDGSADFGNSGKIAKTTEPSGGPAVVRFSENGNLDNRQGGNKAPARRGAGAFLSAGTSAGRSAEVGGIHGQATCRRSGIHRLCPGILNAGRPGTSPPRGGEVVTMSRGVKVTTGALWSLMPAIPRVTNAGSPGGFTYPCTIGAVCNLHTHSATAQGGKLVPLPRREGGTNLVPPSTIRGGYQLPRALPGAVTPGQSWNWVTNVTPGQSWLGVTGGTVIESQSYTSMYSQAHHHPYSAKAEGIGKIPIVSKLRLYVTTALPGILARGYSWIPASRGKSSNNPEARVTNNPGSPGRPLAGRPASDSTEKTQNSHIVRFVGQNPRPPSTPTTLVLGAESRCNVRLAKKVGRNQRPFIAAVIADPALADTGAKEERLLSSADPTVDNCPPSAVTHLQSWNWVTGVMIFCTGAFCHSADGLSYGALVQYDFTALPESLAGRSASDRPKAIYARLYLADRRLIWYI